MVNKRSFGYDTNFGTESVGNNMNINMSPIISTYAFLYAIKKISFDSSNEIICNQSCC